MVGWSDEIKCNVNCSVQRHHCRVNSHCTVSISTSYNALDMWHNHSTARQDHNILIVLRYSDEDFCHPMLLLEFPNYFSSNSLGSFGFIMWIKACVRVQALPVHTHSFPRKPHTHLAPTEPQELYCGMKIRIFVTWWEVTTETTWNDIQSTLVPFYRLVGCSSYPWPPELFADQFASYKRSISKFWVGPTIRYRLTLRRHPEGNCTEIYSTDHQFALICKGHPAFKLTALQLSPARTN